MTTDTILPDFSGTTKRDVLQLFGVLVALVLAYFVTPETVVNHLVRHDYLSSELRTPFSTNFVDYLEGAWRVGVLAGFVLVVGGLRHELRDPKPLTRAGVVAPVLLLAGLGIADGAFVVAMHLLEGHTYSLTRWSYEFADALASGLIIYPYILAIIVGIHFAHTEFDGAAAYRRYGARLLAVGFAISLWRGVWGLVSVQLGNRLEGEQAQPLFAELLAELIQATNYAGRVLWWGVAALLALALARGAKRVAARGGLSRDVRRGEAES